MRILLFGRTKSDLSPSVLKAINISHCCKYILLLLFVYKNASMSNPQIHSYPGVLVYSQPATKYHAAAH